MAFVPVTRVSHRDLSSQSCRSLSINVKCTLCAQDATSGRNTIALALKLLWWYLRL